MPRLKLLGSQNEEVRGIIIQAEPEIRFDEKFCWICHKRPPKWARQYGHEEIKVCDECKEAWN